MSSTAERVIALTKLARSRILPGPQENVGDPIDSRMEAVAHLVQAGETAVAFEILSDNLLDYDIRLTEDDFEEASAVATELTIDFHRYVTPLRELVVAADRIVVTRRVD